MENFFILAAFVLGICIVFFAMKIKRHRSRRRLVLLLFFDNLKIEGFIMALSMTATQKVAGALKPIDKKGNPAPVDEGSVSVTSSNEDVFVVERDSEDEKKFTLVAVGPGVAQLDYSADADLDDEGIKTISGFAAIEVLPAQAVGFGIEFAAPVEQETEESPEA
jgi:hypothetical protein